MRLDRYATIRVGRLGRARFRPGFYTYAGSALGPGGLAARVGRHALGSDVIHWHIDHLSRLAPVREAWFATGRMRREHAWACALARLSGTAAPIAGFGASDCCCRSHLVYFSVPPTLDAFRNAVHGSGSECATLRHSPNGRCKPTIEKATFA
ncbi:MAG: GIY-YIG nuclease family protein [Betaproteobacteria bacterium]|nr:GIY-YIG nuclease family protein [Betaproteobacteria bacterium]